MRLGGWTSVIIGMEVEDGAALAWYGIRQFFLSRCTWFLFALTPTSLASFIYYVSVNLRLFVCGAFLTVDTLNYHLEVRESESGLCLVW